LVKQGGRRRIICPFKEGNSDIWIASPVLVTRRSQEWQAPLAPLLAAGSDEMKDHFSAAEKILNHFTTLWHV